VYYYLLSQYNTRERSRFSQTLIIHATITQAAHNLSTAPQSCDTTSVMMTM